MEKFLLDRDNSALLIIDIQERLAAVMKAKEPVVQNCIHLIELAKMLGIPVIVTEQYPKGLGQTVEEIRSSLAEYRPVEKMTFSCCDEPAFLDAIRKLNRKTLIVTGMETHICVLQTSLGLILNGFNVHLVKDAVCSRAKENWKTACGFMRDAGAAITCTEAVLFQVLKIAGTEEFKSVAKRIK
ncbi:MAG: hydrolase [Nitrospirota bacterium]